LTEKIIRLGRLGRVGEPLGVTFFRMTESVCLVLGSFLSRDIPGTMTKKKITRLHFSPLVTMSLPLTVKINVREGED